jgi:outer membrane protein assembly factor BamB
MFHHEKKMRTHTKSLLFVLTLVLAVGLLFKNDPLLGQAKKAAGKAPAKSAATAVREADWPELRGPNRNGTSPETGLPEKWTLQGENLLWRVPIGSISGPVVHGDHVYLSAPRGKGPTLQEHLMCFDAKSGKTLWDRPISIYHSDVPPHRIAWASPGVDLETGNVYAFEANGILAAFSRDGKPLWTRYVTEEFGLITTHGGRTVSPVIDGDKVIVFGITFNWGDQAGGGTRIYAFDKNNGELIWMSNPGGRPTDTTYAATYVTEINGTRMVIVGLSDGAMHAVKAETGEPVWRYLVSKRGINTGVILLGTDALITHSEENVDTNEMGMRAAVDATSTGALTAKNVKWMHYGFQGGFASPVSDGKAFYQVDNGALLGAFDVATGNELWTKKIGTVHKASAVLGDGKLYVGTESGKFWILRPRMDGCDVLSEVLLGPENDPEQVTGNAAISRGRVYFASKNALYAIGKKGSVVPPWKPTAIKPATTKVSNEAPAFVQVVPADVAVLAGENVKFRARLFDAKGNFIKESPAEWSLEQISGAMEPNGNFTASSASKGDAGKVKATVGGMTGESRVRVIPPLPWTFDFQDTAIGALPSWWVNARLKYGVKEIDGGKVLTKLADNTFSFIKRARTYSGFPTWNNLTIESDLRFQMRRRQLGDGGVSTQGYQLVLFGNHNRLELQSWQPETERTKTVEFEVKPDTWYHLKLRVENLKDGSVRALGKAWLAGQPEPEKWTLERTDPRGFGIQNSSPGIYGDAISEVYFDNIKIHPNK